MALAKALKVERVAAAPLGFGFDTEAKRLAFAIADGPLPHRMGWHTSVLAETFRLIWHARRSADIAAVQSTLTPPDGGTYAKSLDRAIRRLDQLTAIELARILIDLVDAAASFWR